MGSININTSGDISGMSLDLRSLDQLKGRASQDPKAAALDAAKQLESLFMQELMKSMRATTMNSGMLDNAGSEMGTEMLDGEMSKRMSGMPGGLTAAIVRQLERSFTAQAAQPSGQTSAHPAAAVAPADAAGAAQAKGGASSAKAESFVRRHLDDAKAAEAATGIPSAHILGQAALESGWGRSEIRNADGSTTHNIFGIKAGANWKGKVAEVTTTEYVNGVAQKVKAKFRAYDSYADAFIDHANLLKKSARYNPVIAQGGTAQGFAKSLQRSGYATDPAYADKLTRTINTTLRLQRAVT